MYLKMLFIYLCVYKHTHTHMWMYVPVGMNTMCAHMQMAENNSWESVLSFPFVVPVIELRFDSRGFSHSLALGNACYNVTSC